MKWLINYQKLLSFRFHKNTVRGPHNFRRFSLWAMSNTEICPRVNDKQKSIFSISDRWNNLFEKPYLLKHPRLRTLAEIVVNVPWRSFLTIHHILVLYWLISRPALITSCRDMHLQKDGKKFGRKYVLW